MKLVLLILLVFVSTNVHSERSNQKNKIAGAFGFQLGAVFDLNSAIKEGTLTDGRVLYSIKPIKPVRGLSSYYVLLTPKTKRIYRISAQQKFNSQPECLKEMNVLKAALTNKYGEFKKTRTYALDTTVYYESGVRNIQLMCDRNVRDADFVVTYVDYELKEQSSKEYTELEINKGGLDGL